jgi:hypothetical protein
LRSRAEFCLVGALTAGAHRAAAARVTARIAPAVAINCTAFGRRLLIRFYGVSIWILLTGVAA